MFYMFRQFNDLGISGLYILIKARPHYAGKIWKGTFFSTVRPTVHNNPSWQRSFLKPLFKPGEFENEGFAF